MPPRTSSATPRPDRVTEPVVSRAADLAAECAPCPTAGPRAAALRRGPRRTRVEPLDVSGGALADLAVRRLPRDARRRRPASSSGSTPGTASTGSSRSTCADPTRRPPRRRRSRRSDDRGAAAGAPGEEVVLRDLEWTDLARLAELEQRALRRRRVVRGDLVERARRSPPPRLRRRRRTGRHHRRVCRPRRRGGRRRRHDDRDGPRPPGPRHRARAARRARPPGDARAGSRRVLLEVRADNDAARRLYDRAGFEVISVRRRYYQPGDVDALVMRLLVTKGDA